MSDKHNRLESQFNLVSAFWEPEFPDNPLTGTLVNDDDGLTFTTSPKYGYRIRVGSLAELMRFSESGAVPRIAFMHGFSADGICTLCQLTEIAHPGLRDTSSGHWIEANSYRASLLVGGMHLDGLDDKVLTSARFSYTGLGEWLPGPLNESWETDHILLRIPLEERVIFRLGILGTQVHASLKVHSEIISTEDDGGRLTRPIAFVEIESSVPSDAVERDCAQGESHERDAETECRRLPTSERGRPPPCRIGIPAPRIDGGARKSLATITLLL